MPDCACSVIGSRYRANSLGISRRPRAALSSFKVAVRTQEVGQLQLHTRLLSVAEPACFDFSGNEPLHLMITGTQQCVDAAKALAHNLVATVRSEYQTFMAAFQ